MIVAVNPYQWIDTLYTEKQRELFANRLVWESSENDPRDYLNPHVYETSALAYKGMAFEGQNQSILVSGESGAGKTETVKICMNHIASVQEGPQSSSGRSSNAEGSSLVVQRVVSTSSSSKDCVRACAPFILHQLSCPTCHGKTLDSLTPTLF